MIHVGKQYALKWPKFPHLINALFAAKGRHIEPPVLVPFSRDLLDRSAVLNRAAIWAQAQDEPEMAATIAEIARKLEHAHREAIA